MTTPCASALAQSVPVPQLNLRIAEAMQRAEANNPQLLAARRSVSVAEVGVAVAGGGPNPRLSVNISVGGIADTKRTLFLEQPIELGGKRGARLALAEDQVRAAQLQLQALRWQIRADVRQAFAELAIAEAARDQMKQTVELAGQLVEIASKRLKAGDVAEADLIQTRFVLERVRQRLEPTDNRVRQAAIRLNTLLGESTEQPVAPADGHLFSLSLEQNRVVAQVPPPLPDLAMLKQAARTRRLDLALATLQERLADDQVTLARSAQVPDLTLAGGFFWDPRIESTSGLVGIRIDLPVFNNRQAEVDQALAGRSVVDARRLALLQQVEREVAAAYQDAASAARLLERDRTVLLPQAERVLALARKSYQFGQTGLSEVLIAQQAIQDQRDAYFNDVLAYQTALGALERAVNQPLTEEGPNVPTSP